MYYENRAKQFLIREEVLLKINQEGGLGLEERYIEARRDTQPIHKNHMGSAKWLFHYAKL